MAHAQDRSVSGDAQACEEQTKWIETAAPEPDTSDATMRPVETMKRLVSSVRW
jgi:hypothetical protein